VTIGSFDELTSEVLRRPPRLGPTRLVCIDGPSGAGKTAFADGLAAALRAATGEQVQIVHTDDLLDGWDDQLAFWPRLERQVLAPIRAGGSGRYRPYDWERGRFADVWRSVPPTAVLLLEGVSAARAEVRPEASFTVFVTAPDQLRLSRAIARDGVALRPYLEQWRLREERHFAADATAYHVDLVVDTADERWTGRWQLGHDRRNGHDRGTG
jgi:uridine kinase